MSDEHDAEMVAISRGWVEQRIAQYRDQKANPIHTWAWRMYADLCEIAEFDALDDGTGAQP